MKFTIIEIAGTLALAAGIQVASAQFTGKLVYEVDRPETRLTMTYFQDKSHGRVEAYSVRMNNGIPDMSTVKAQDTLLLDFARATETHLQKLTKTAYITQYTFNMEALASAMKDQQLDCQSVGQETISGYHCTHFVMTQTAHGFTSKKEVWITKDLGQAPSLYVVGNFLYYTPGHPLLTKLIQAGGDGVVVRAIQSAGGLSATVNLLSVDKKTPSASLFQVPSGYTTMDRTHETAPTHK
jgi:hypothetical protein